MAEVEEIRIPRYVAKYKVIPTDEGEYAVVFIRYRDTHEDCGGVMFEGKHCLEEAMQYANEFNLSWVLIHQLVDHLTAR